jgi:hypothetical protein
LLAFLEVLRVKGYTNSFAGDGIPLLPRQQLISNLLTNCDLENLSQQMNQWIMKV